MDYKALFSKLDKGQIGNIYIFTGPEEYVKAKALDKLLIAAVDTLPEVNIARLQANAAQEDIIAACEVMPMMATRRAVVVRDCQALLRRTKADTEQEDETESAPIKHGKQKDEPLAAYAANPNTYTCLVFYFSADKEPSGKLFKSIEKNAETVRFDRVDESTLPKWVAQQFASYGKRVERDAIGHLIDLCGTELVLLSNEIAKIAAYAGEDEAVNARHVLALASRSMEYSVFRMIDCIATRQPKAALEIAAELSAQGQDPMGLISLMSSHYHNLLITRKLNGNAREAERILGVKGFVAEKLAKQARAYTDAQLANSVRLLLDADEGIKSGQYNAEMTLAGLIGRLAEK